MPSSSVGRRALGDVLEEAWPSGKPRVTTLPSTAIGPAAVMSGLVGGTALEVGHDRPATAGRRRSRSPTPAAGAVERRPGAGSAAAGCRRAVRGAVDGPAGPRRRRWSAGGPARSRPAAGGDRVGGLGPAPRRVGGVAAGRRPCGAPARRRRSAGGRRRAARPRIASRRRLGAGAATGVDRGRRPAPARSASSSWKRRPPDAASARVDRGEASGGRRSSAPAGRPASPASAEARDERRRGAASTTWSRKAPRSRPRVLEVVEDRRSRPAASPPTRARDERVDRLGVGEPSRSRTRVCGEALARRRRAAGRASTRRRASRRPPGGRRGAIAAGVGLPAVGLEDRAGACPRSRARSGGRKSKRWRRDRTAGRILARVGRAEDEDDVVGRLLERLEERRPSPA